MTSITPAHLRQEAKQKALAVISELDLPAGCALAATGSLARNEMTPYSDLDLLLLHPPTVDNVDVSGLWYPIWDAKLRLDYAVRTPAECAAIIKEDTTAALALLDIEYLAGDEALVAETKQQVYATWRRFLPKTFDQVVATAIARWRRSGSVVAMTHPDLKHGRGGLRDLDFLHALALAHLVDAPNLAAERALLNDIRTLLHVESRRSRDVLDPEFAAAIAAELGYADRYELAKSLAEAGRKIDEALTTALTHARSVLPKPRGVLRRQQRLPLDLDVIDAAGTITLSRNPNLADPGLVLRVAAAAARTGLQVAASTWRQLQQVPALPTPWNAAATSDFIAILASEEHGGAVIKELDKYNLLAGLVPAWSHIRGLMPHERTHVTTVDQHSLNTVALCAAATVRVARPDLLLLAAFFHDMGKGYDRPHAEVGAELVKEQAQRMGLDHASVATVELLVAQHTLLAQMASTKDVRDPEVVAKLLDLLHYDPLVVELLGVLTYADATATGPGVWTARLAAGVDSLVRSAMAQLTSLTPHPPTIELPQSMSEPVALVVSGSQPAVFWRGSERAELKKVLAVLAAKGWKIEDTAISENDSQQVVARFLIRPTAGSDLDEFGFVQAYKSGVFAQVPAVTPAATAIFWQENLLEIRTIDRPGLLARLFELVPPTKWITAVNPGATMVAKFQLCGPADKVAVERAVLKALAGS